MQRRPWLVALLMAGAAVAVPLAQKLPVPKPAPRPSAAALKLDDLKQEAIAEVESRGRFSRQTVDQIVSIDCIPQASQKPGVAWHDTIIEGAPGHGERHNSGQAVNITAALAVKKIIEREHLPGTIRIWPGTAEELVGTKAHYIRRSVAVHDLSRTARDQIPDDERQQFTLNSSPVETAQISVHSTCKL